MELRQLRYFVAVAEERSFSRAAERLHVSQPPLSTQIKHLEQALGVRLFERSNRGVSLTAAGQGYFTEVTAALARLEQAQVRVLQIDRGEVGRLAIGFVSIADYGILPPTLKRFRARFPQVEVQLHEYTTDAQIRELRDARLDLGIGLAPVDEPDLTFAPVAREALVLAAPTGHPVIGRSGQPVELHRLARESFIVPPRDIAPGLYDLTISRCRAAGFVPRITQQARQMQTVIGLVSCGMGVALVPDSVHNLQRVGVQYRPLRGVPAMIEMGVLSCRGTHSATRDQFVDTLVEVAGSDPA